MTYGCASPSSHAPGLRHLCPRNGVPSGGVKDISDRRRFRVADFPNVFRATFFFCEIYPPPCRVGYVGRMTYLILLLLLALCALARGGVWVCVQACGRSVRLGDAGRAAGAGVGVGSLRTDPRSWALALSDKQVARVGRGPACERAACREGWGLEDYELSKAVALSRPGPRPGAGDTGIARVSAWRSRHSRVAARRCRVGGGGRCAGWGPRASRSTG